MTLDDWKKECLERDDYKDQILGGEAVTVHHIIKRRFEEFLTDVDNGLSVSADGHDFVENEDNDSWSLIQAAVDVQDSERLGRLREKFIRLHRYDYFKGKIEFN